MAESQKTTNTAGSITFACPSCTNAKITRSKHERQLGALYTCPECGFQGPN